VFLGPEGLRAGWSVLLFAALWWSFEIAAEFLAGPLLRQDLAEPLRPLTTMLSEGCRLFAVAAATGLMAFFERRPVLSYGFEGRARRVRFFWGLVWGFVAISALVFCLDKLGYLSLDGVGLGGAAALRFAVLWGVMFLLVGFFEESLLRGYAQFTLTRGIGFWWGALLLSFGFGFGHRLNPGESPVGLIAAGAVGLVFCLSLWYTGSLWWAVGFHAAWDWGESYFYGTADSGTVARGHLLREHPLGNALWSGGTTGPEGSWLVFPLLLAIALLMVGWWGRRGETPFRGMGWRPGGT
jgi:hypothetical protein